MTIAIVGAGFTGLSAAYDLAKAGRKVIVFDSDGEPGGLAGGFPIGSSTLLEKFYHHWFVSDRHIMDLIADLGLQNNILHRQSQTGLYYNNRLFRLSSPVDVLKFTALPFLDRLRLGFLVLQVRMIKDWRSIEHLSVEEWLVGLCGRRVYDLVWAPLLDAKFSTYKDEISATWFLLKLQLRGGSRGKNGSEILAYYKGGFAALAQQLRNAIVAAGGEVRLGQTVSQIDVHEGQATGVRLASGEQVPADQILLTTALPIAADLLAQSAPSDWLQALRKVQYLANRCIVLELDRSLSTTYWINVNEPGFPFVGVIEHTNFEPPETYGGKHIVYLSRYMPDSDPLYTISDDLYVAYALPYIKRMFPDFDESWIHAAHVWKADHAQPVTTRNYSKMIPSHVTPIKGVTLFSMAQIYPEDRGTNYAVREGRKAAALLTPP
ncbi:NAD(P)/FAD-dependent oxidoreductase [Tabrizicola sp.]|uniref:NAD(P)/FAD-dependent oxidoreductase n=1 Tax=Tabrizicola sp. TaxID=2005166 RepID=UPI0027327A83|nr:NAD(P)/FAD-dependent oxidoreductase [Tabrizicola sp.]MDP3196651.1 NAD(P)/FAD-dependent oxidoreductase [Tabrizicola sp.]